MADESDVETTLATLITAQIYPQGTNAPSALGPLVRIYRGWPNPTALNADLAAGIINISLSANPAHHRNTTRYIDPPTAMVHLPFRFEVGILGPDETTLCIDGVPLPAAIRIDRRYDDGNPLTGDVRSILQVSGEDGDGVPRMRLCRKIWR